jgi:hypothetical protein
MRPFAKKPRCATCEKRIRPHHQDLVLEDLGTGRRRYYHGDRCAASAYELAARRPAVYVLYVRHVDFAVN